MTTKAVDGMPLSAVRALRRLGGDVCVARKKRKITSASMAERAFISRPTLRKIENGDPGVSIGMYISVLAILGLADRIGTLAAPAADEIGLLLDEQRLPKRVRAGK